MTSPLSRAAATLRPFAAPAQVAPPLERNGSPTPSWASARSTLSDVSFSSSDDAGDAGAADVAVDPPRAVLAGSLARSFGTTSAPADRLAQDAFPDLAASQRLARGPYAIEPPHKRSRTRTPTPVTSGTATPILNAADKFALLLEQGARHVPAEAQANWRQAMQNLCVMRRDRPVTDSVNLLDRVLAMPPALQQPLASAANAYFLANRSRYEIRVEVFAALGHVATHAGTEAFQALCEAGAKMRLGSRPQLELARELLLAVRKHVPAAHTAHFLCAAECLLEGQHKDDFRRVIEAAKECSGRVVGRGKTKHEQALAGGRSDVQEAAVDPREFTAHDWAVLHRGMLGAHFNRTDSMEGYAPSDDDDGEETCPGLRPPVMEDGSLPYWYAETENVQRAGRIAAVRAAWAQLNEIHPRRLPSRALWLLADGAYCALVRQASAGQTAFAADGLGRVEKDYATRVASVADEKRILANLRPKAPREAYKLLRHVWEGSPNADVPPAFDENRIPPLKADALVENALDELDLSARAFIGQVWSILHAARGPLAQDPAEKRRERDNMRYSFFSAVMSNVVVHVLPAQSVVGVPRYKLELQRLCANGLAQRVLTALSGYEPISVDRVTPEQMLSQLARQFTAPFGEDAEPTASELACFYLAALEAAKAAFAAEELEVFGAQLVDYVRFDYADVADEALALAEVEQAAPGQRARPAAS